MTNPIRDESELHLEAMLYVLDDPSMDRTAFEERLIDDVRLGEILAEAVSMFQTLRSMDANFETFLSLPRSNENTLDGVSTVKTRHVAWSSSRWLRLTSLAATIVLVGFMGWKSFQAMTPGQGRDDADRWTNGSRSLSDSTSMNKVVWAWGEVQTGSRDDSTMHHANFADSDVALASCDTLCNNDVPEWLVLATAAVLEQSGAVESPLENVDARTLLQ